MGGAHAAAMKDAISQHGHRKDYASGMAEARDANTEAVTSMH